MTTNGTRHRAIAFVLSLGLGAGLLMNAPVARAMEGLLPHAFGLRHKGLAGAGVAAVRDATGIMLNPAGLVGAGQQINAGLSLFVPTRGFETVDTLETDWGRFDGRRRVFVAPSFAWVRPLGANSAIGVSLDVSTGLKTDYKGTSGFLGLGPYYTGRAGTELQRIFLSVAWAHRLDEGFNIGIAPVFVVQRFKAWGLEPFLSGLSVDPENVSDRGFSTAYGAGVRFGVQWQATERLSIGAAFRTPIWMSRFRKYRGLFANGGDLDLPATLQVGLAYSLTDDLRLMLDYRHIFYGGIKALANPGRDCFAAPPGSMLGGSDGCGFHWREVDILKLGLEYQATDSLTLRLGYAHAFQNPVRSEAVLLNTFMPGTVRHEFTGGATWRVNDHHSVDFAFMFAPRTKVSGPEIMPWAGTSFGGRIQSWARQFEVSVGWTYNFGNGSTRAR